MIMETKRLYVGNLPPDSTRDLIEKKFNKFGNVKSVEIKQRQDGSTYAFLDFTSSNEMLNSCFRKLSKKEWNGHLLKLEIARESFLSRLQRERQQAERHNSDKKVNKVEENRILDERKGEETKYKKKKIYKFSDDSDDECKRNLKKFPGINNIESSKSKSLSEESVLKKGSEDMLQRLESFSDFWKDPETVSKHLKNNENITCSKSVIKNDRRSFNSNLNEKVSIKSKNAVADEKRLKSLHEKIKSFQMQKNIIKTALKSVESPYQNRKIVFNDDGEELGKNLSDHVSEIQTKNVLFQEASEDEQEDFKIKRQFEGKKGKKLLELKSRYASDKRFTLDERFYENDDDNPSEDTPEIEDERKKQLEILQEVVGHKISISEEKNKQPKSASMVRFDPSQPDHAKFEKESKPKRKKKINGSLLDLFDAEPEKHRRIEKQNNENTKIYSEKNFYKITDTLKEAFQKKSSQNSFSIRSLCNKSGEEEPEDNREETYSTVPLRKSKDMSWTSNPFKYDSSEGEEEKEETNRTKNNAIKKPNRTKNNAIKNYTKYEIHSDTTFFFKPDDPRLKEGLDFFNGSQIVEESPSNFAERRRQLKEIVHVKILKSKRRHRPFLKKLGGQRQNKKNNLNFKKK